MKYKKIKNQVSLHGRIPVSIVICLRMENRPLSIKEIAKLANISWITAKNYITHLEKREWVEKKEKKYILSDPLDFLINERVKEIYQANKDHLEVTNDLKIYKKKKED